jgi:ornithine cyclodeaminase
MAECIDVMAEALAATTRGEALLPLRQVLRLHGGADAFAVMPAVLGTSIGAKIITVFPGNDTTPYESHIGVVLYFDDTHGRLLAIIDASSVTAIRTAAVSGLATRLLALPNASALAILGTGAQAMKHLEAVKAVRPITQVRVWSRSAERRARFAAWGSERFGVEIVACDTAQAAVRDAHVVCTVTSSRTPVLEGAWLAPGAHVNAVGASLRTARELDSDAVVRSRMYVDRRESVLNESGDYLVPRDEGAIDERHIRGEIGELVTGSARGREDERQITLFKSLGLAVEDVASARFIYERARASGAGTWLTIGGLRAEGL